MWKGREKTTLMHLNLINDAWIPVLRDGEITTIRPHEISVSHTTALAWSRPDFNLACLELLIGMVSMMCPPQDIGEWREMLNQPDADKLHDSMEPFAEFFNLGGDGPRFLQDLEPFECQLKTKEIKPLDMLFIDSVGNQTVKNNADLTVKRNRFPSLTPAESAMALYTLQAYAPAGGAGNRTSMRGGGPLTTLVQPLESSHDQSAIWRLVFCNVLPRRRLDPGDAHQALPWLRKTKTSERDRAVPNNHTHDLEAFFGMPRRLRLVFDGSRVSGVVQRPYGTNYESWKHPLTPYYRKAPDDLEWLAVHPKPGRISYRNWLGTTMVSAQNNDGTRQTARTLSEFTSRSGDIPDFELLVGGWAMSNMSPLDFSLDTYPAFATLDVDAENRVRCLIEASKSASDSLRKALKVCQVNGNSLDSLTELFYSETEADFVICIRNIIDSVGAEVEERWYSRLSEVANRVFDDQVANGIADHTIDAIEKRILARQKLRGELYKKLRQKLEPPDREEQSR